jgi:hypothetical protein
MGACISEDLTVEQPEEITAMTIAERHKSLVEFVHALTESPHTKNINKENTHKSVPVGVITLKSIDELTPQQEAFISGFKMQVYGQKSDDIRQISTFEYIENEFYNKYHKRLSRKVLYSLFGI